MARFEVTFARHHRPERAAHICQWDAQGTCEGDLVSAFSGGVVPLFLLATGGCGHSAMLLKGDVARLTCGFPVATWRGFDKDAYHSADAMRAFGWVCVCEDNDSHTRDDPSGRRGEAEAAADYARHLAGDIYAQAVQIPGAGALNVATPHDHISRHLERQAQSSSTVNCNPACKAALLFANVELPFPTG